MGPRGVVIKDVELIKQATEGKIKIKVAGGVDTYAEAIALINAGASRIGTSKAVEIVTSYTLFRRSFCNVDGPLVSISTQNVQLPAELFQFYPQSQKHPILSYQCSNFL